MALYWTNLLTIGNIIYNRLLNYLNPFANPKDILSVACVYMLSHAYARCRMYMLSCAYARCRMRMHAVGYHVGYLRLPRQAERGNLSFFYILYGFFGYFTLVYKNRW